MVESAEVSSDSREKDGGPELQGEAQRWVAEARNAGT